MSSNHWTIRSGIKGALRSGKFRWACLTLFVAGLPASPAMAGKVAVLQGLNKVTARVSAIEARIDEIVHFGNLKIVALACHKAPPEETPESAVLLTIEEEKLDEERVELFAGWMFASSPALFALEHPVYDIWVVDCKNESPPPTELDPSPG